MYSVIQQSGLSESLIIFLNGFKLVKLEAFEKWVATRNEWFWVRKLKKEQGEKRKISNTSNFMSLTPIKVNISDSESPDHYL